MTVAGTASRAIAFAVAVLIAGCGSQLPSAKATVSADRLQSVPRGSWMMPGTSSEDLLYAVGFSDSTGNKIYVLSYPAGQLVGQLDVEASGLCSDTKGNVYVTNRDAVIEYPHGGTTPVYTYRVPGASTANCAVEPTSGNLAVTFYCPVCGYQTLAIFPNGSSTSTRYDAPDAYVVAYDGARNLFLVNYDGQGLAELPADSSSFKGITLSGDIGQDHGQAQWDGKYLAIQNLSAPGGIYRVSISGSTATVAGHVKFDRYMKASDFSWISGDTVVVPFSGHGRYPNQLGIWKYPRGGRQIGLLKGIGSGERGFGAVTVSVAGTR